ncbi:LANO_0C01200g1_1 [Lachancea nothofagi CBS 11611]|uniref:LANO_0C01200g1_1 n=1 Tax=Lachancea nothofagi CBS 11611 TaxID=1266666 RepID=A0A1G4J4I1_9SACH|nr:LANO_0C01200g1_1 [Lachancea nothofagi CBS 11611]
MALTNSRPLQIPALENEALHNSASPIFQPSSLSSSSQGGSLESLAERSSSSLTSDAGGDSAGSETPLGRKDLLALKRSAASSPVPSSSAASELSIMVPVTGQRPKPNKKDLSMDDDILLAIFVILFEKDPHQKGVTVKQLCDYVAEKHPDMAGASTKLSNLISAKLNAYVKKVEKGEKTLKYALSRQWSEGSPRRMVYVYRGTLAPDYKSHTQSMMLQRHDSKQKTGKSNGSSKKGQTASQGSNDANADTTGERNGGQSNRSFAVNNSFTVSSFATDFNIPYAASPVTMRLIPHNSESGSDAASLEAVKDRMPQSSFNEPPNKKPKIQPGLPGAAAPYVTAAAAAPRLNKVATKKSLGPHDSMNAAVSTIQRLMVTQKPVESILPSTDNVLEPYSPGLTCNSWLRTIRSGFLLEEIESPEAVSVEDLDGLFQ